MSITESLKILSGRGDLTEEQAYAAMSDIMSGTVGAASVGAYLTALRLKGETISEIVGSVKAMRDKAQNIDAGDVMDIVGTGGDGHNTFNISSVSAVVAAACGVKVAKHGNKAATSLSGSADVMEALGYNLEVTPAKTAEMINNIGYGFMNATMYHSAMKFVAPVRKELGFRTIFNIMGPLCNPARASHMLLGVHSTSLIRPLAEVLKGLGVKTALVVSGNDGLDEVSPAARTQVVELFEDGNIVSYSVAPQDFGLEVGSLEGIKGGLKDVNKQIMMDILNGAKSVRRDTVLLNTAMALKTVLKKPLKECAEVAAEAIDSGRALRKLSEIIDASNS